MIGRRNVCRKSILAAHTASVLIGCMSLLMALLLTGCGGGGGSGAVSSGGTDTSTEKAAAVKQEQEEAQKEAEQHAALLDNVRHGLDPVRLGVSTDLPYVISMLNQWHDGNVTTQGDKAKTSVEIPPRVVKLIGEDQANLMNDPVYRELDGIYLRDCKIAKSISNYATVNARSDLAKSVKLFEYVIRTIRYSQDHMGWIPHAPEQRVDVPMTLYDLCLLGFGTTQDRAWLFSALLRQIGLDSVLIFPESGNQAQGFGGHMLMGVIIGQQVYLFDLHNGVPIPGPAGVAETPDKPSVATLEEVTAHPELLRQLDPIPNVVLYDLKGELFRKPNVMIAGSLPLWSAKMKSLQPHFSGKDTMVIFDELADHDGKPGMLTRIVKAGGKFWNADSLNMWSYPQFSMRSSLQLQPPAVAVKNQLLLSMRATFPWAFSAKENKVEISKGKGQLQEARLAHLTEDFGSALKLYNDVRSAAKNNPIRQHNPQQTTMVSLDPSENPAVLVRYGFDRSDDDGTYFTGMCQYDQKNYKAAAATLRKYLDGFVRDRQQLEKVFQQMATQQGLPRPNADMRKEMGFLITARFFWVNSARLTLALALRELGEKTEAAKTLQAIPISNSQFVGYLRMMRQLDPAVAAEPQKELQKQFDAFQEQQKAAAGAAGKPEPFTGTPPKTPTVPPKQEKPENKKPDDKKPATPAPAPEKSPASTSPTPPAVKPEKSADGKNTSASSPPSTPAKSPATTTPATPKTDRSPDDKSAPTNKTPAVAPPDKPAKEAVPPASKSSSTSETPPVKTPEKK